jgi:chemotaxis regulatin CheY-phosphate phosphatase CheZ
MSKLSNISNMAQVFDKLNDLKMLFTYGQKLIPIIKSLVDFMHETVPLLENINSSISDTTSKIPKASNQINNVTSATELATTEILDIVDSISNDITKLEGALKVHKEESEKRDEVFNEIKLMLGDSPKAKELIEKYEELNVTTRNMDELLTIFAKIRDDAYNITLSLQVQDITSQQLAAVNHLIESVHVRLSSLIIDIDDTDLQEYDSTGIEVPDDATFDPNASYDKSAERQEQVDDIINKENEQASQSEIDKLFS